MHKQKREIVHVLRFREINTVDGFDEKKTSSTFSGILRDRVPPYNVRPFKLRSDCTLNQVDPI